MSFFFDNHVSPNLVRFLRESAADEESEEYRHLRDPKGWPAGDPGDDVWIPAVCGYGGPWIIVTADLDRDPNPRSRQAWRDCAAPVLHLAEGYQNLPVREQAQRLLKAWPKVLEWARGRPTPGNYKLRAAGGKVERMK